MKNSENVFDFFAHEDDYPDLDCNLAVSHLSQALKCQSVSECEDPAPFYALHKLIKSAYPHIMEEGTMEILDRSVLICIEGHGSSALPALFMSHLDVVPVIPGTESNWLHEAFSGDIADGYIWGRGALDIKEQVFGVLEAVEYLLAHGIKPSRTIYLAFGQDEETTGTAGAQKIAALLASRNVRLEFLLDEGGGDITDGTPYGAPGTFLSFINTMEKGYADLELTVKSKGGHSSRPFGGTSLAILANAISSIVNNPFPARLPSVMKEAFKALSSYISSEPLRTLVKDVDKNCAAIAEYCLDVEELFPHVTTTIAPTVIRGSSAACNVMPQDMDAVINFRIASGYTPEDIMKHCIKAVDDDRVSFRYLTANPPSATARTDGEAYKKLVEVMSIYYKDVVFVPMETAGSTDARMYEGVCNTCLRFSPFISPLSDVRSGVHGTNERISVRSYMQGIRALIKFIDTACC